MFNRLEGRLAGSVGRACNFFFFMFIFRRERERERISRGEAEREGDAESEKGSRLRAVSTEPNTGLELMRS